MIRVSIRGVDAAKRALEARRDPEVARRGLVSAAHRVVQRIVSDLIPKESPPPVDQGAYRAAWRVDPHPTAGSGLVVDVLNDAPYASIIEFGARPEKIRIGKRMIDALAEWVHRKGLVGRKRPSRGQARANYEAEARGIAWAIARAMQGAGGSRSGGRDAGIFNRAGRKGLRIAERAAVFAAEFVAEEIATALRKAR